MGHRFGVYVDVDNLFNTAGITAVQPRVPEHVHRGQHVLYRSPTAVQGARQVTFGARGRSRECLIGHCYSARSSGVFRP